MLSAALKRIWQSFRWNIFTFWYSLSITQVTVYSLKKSFFKDFDALLHLGFFNNVMYVIAYYHLHQHWQRYFNFFSKFSFNFHIIKLRILSMLHIHIPPVFILYSLSVGYRPWLDFVIESNGQAELFYLVCWFDFWNQWSFDGGLLVDLSKLVGFVPGRVFKFQPLPDLSFACFVWLLFPIPTKYLCIKKRKNVFN